MFHFSWIFEDSLLTQGGDHAGGWVFRSIPPLLYSLASILSAGWSEIFKLGAEPLPGAGIRFCYFAPGQLPHFLFMPLLDIAVRLGHLFERIDPVNDRFQLPRLDQPGEEEQGP